MFGPGPSLRLVLGGASLIPSLSLEVLHSKGAQEQDRCSWPGLAEQCVDPVPVRSDASELLPDGVFGVSESEHVRGVVDDRPALSGNHALRLLAYAEDRCVLGEDHHAASRDVRDPPLVALLGALHLGVYVVLEVGGDPVIVCEAVDRLRYCAPNRVLDVEIANHAASRIAATTSASRAPVSRSISSFEYPSRFLAVIASRRTPVSAVIGCPPATRLSTTNGTARVLNHQRRACSSSS